MSANPRSRCVLVVDDEQILLNILQRMLASSYRVLTASTLGEARSHLKSADPDVLLTDLRLAGGERGESLIEGFAGKLPCIAMTGFGDHALEKEVRALGAVGYLSKPFGQSQLMSAIRDALVVQPKVTEKGPIGSPATPEQVALVLSGGGVRGAYEAGVLQGLVEVLGRGPDDPPPFRTFVGSSVGAINAAWLAGHAHRGDLGVEGLSALWQGILYRDLVQVNMGALLGRRRESWSLLRMEPIARLLRGAFDWGQMSRNLDSGAARALILPALHVRTGRSVMFAQLHDGVDFVVSRDPLRTSRITRIASDHVLASAAIPFLFAPQRVEGDYYVDGGLRHNVPIAPAIRTGASHLVVISTLAGAKESAVEPPRPGPPSIAFLMGKLLNALVLDPLQRDLQILSRFNRLFEVLEQELGVEQRNRVSQVLTETRGMPYRRLETLVITPSDDIGELTQRFLQEHLPKLDLPPLHRWVLTRALLSRQPTAEADWATYVLFDGALARRLVALGRQDAHARREEIQLFFS